MAIKTDYGVKIDASAFTKHLQDFALVMGRNLGQVIKNQAALFCRDMVDYTPPFKSPGDGSSLGAKGIGADKIKGQIRAIFKPIISKTDSASPSEIAAIGREDVFKMWTQAIKQGKMDSYLTSQPRKIKWQKFQQKYASTNIGGNVRYTDRSGMEAFHNSLRSNNGRGSVRKSELKKGNFIFVKDESDVAWYIKQKQKNIGILKSAYFYVSQSLRENVGFPAWVKHPEGQNEQIAINDFNKPLLPEVTVGNRIGNITKEVPASTVNFVLRRRAEKMRAQMVSYLNKNKISLWQATMSGKISGTAKYFS